MGFFTYISEEIYKTQKNYKQLLYSFSVTVGIYGLIALLAYSNWDKVLNFSGDKFYLRYLGPLLWNLFWMFVLHLALHVIYEVKFESLESYRYVQNWPWEKDPVAWNNLYKKTFIMTVLNQCVVFPILTLSLYFFGEHFRVDKESFPHFTEIFWQLIFFHFCFELFSFILHSLMHTEFFYENFHKQHHDYVDTFGIASEYFHPLEFALMTLATFIGPKFLGGKTHIFTFLLWQMTNLYDKIIVYYSGYNFPWRPLGVLPFQNGFNYHNFHHERNLGAFSFYYNFFDRLFGFDYDYNKIVRQEKLKTV